MWRGIVLIGASWPAATLLVLDASMPGGLIEGSHDLRFGQTMAFTTLVFAQLFNVFNARSDRRSAFVRPFSNRFLWGAVLLSAALHFIVLYLPVMQHAFGTVALSARDWLACLVAASSVLWISEAAKLAAPEDLTRLPGVR